jgi:hypothetical protein
MQTKGAIPGSATIVLKLRGVAESLNRHPPEPLSRIFFALCCLMATNVHPSFTTDESTGIPPGR